MIEDQSVGGGRGQRPASQRGVGSQEQPSLERLNLSAHEVELLALYFYDRRTILELARWFRVSKQAIWKRIVALLSRFDDADLPRPPPPQAPIRVNRVVHFDPSQIDSVDALRRMLRGMA